MRSIRISVAAAGLAIAAATIPIAGAQDQPPPQGSRFGSMMGGWGWGPHGMMGHGGYGMGPWMMGRGGHWRGDPSRRSAMCNRMAGHVEGRLAYVKAELKITDAQETLWKAYADTARDNAKTLVAHCTTLFNQSSSATTSLPERLDLHEQVMAAQLDAMRAMNKALKPLYAALSDNQKKTANQLFWGRMMM